MDTAKKIELLEEMFEVDEGTLTPDMKLTDIDEWDSMTALSLIVLIDEECGKRITGDEVKKLVIIQDILDIMG